MLREGLLRRDASVASKRKRKKRLIRLQVDPYRYRLTGVILPVRKYLQALAPQTFSHSGTTSAASSTWYILASIITSVGLYLWREGLYSKAKRRTMDRTTAQCVVAFNVLWM